MQTPAPIKDFAPEAVAPKEQQVAAYQAHDSALIDEKTHKVMKTTGEKWFDAIRFATGEGVILGLTAVLAYVSKYGKNSYGGMPNYLKKMDEGTFGALMKRDFFKNHEHGERIAGAVAGTTTLMHGGNVFIPVMNGLNNHKHNIVDSINRRWGKPGELEAGQERLKAQEPETWGDIIKGRIVSWGAVFSGLLGADLLLGKKKGTDTYWSDIGKNKVARLITRTTEKGRDILSRVPEGEFVSEELKAFKPYRYGKILALDVFATTAALAIWTSISKLSAILRKKKNIVEHEEEHLAIFDAGKKAGLEAVAQEPILQTETVQTNVTEKTVSHTARVGDRPADFRGRAEKDTAAGMAMSQ
jgi:hypothetical protein